MSDPPTISELTISMIAMDRPKFFRAAIESLLRTTPSGATLQLTINDSGPETRTVADWALGEWDGPTFLFETPSCLDFVDAHNFALSNVGTPFVNFIGDDDLNLKPRFERQLAQFSDARVLAVGTFAHRVGARSGKRIRSFGKMDIGPISSDEMTATLEADKPIYFVFPSVVVRSQAVRDIGGLRPVFGPAADIDLWTRLAERGWVIAIPDRALGFRVHDGAGSTVHFFEARRMTRYSTDCQRARRRQNPEPSVAEHLSNQGNFFKRASLKMADASKYNFRRAGAAWLESRFVQFFYRITVAFLLSPVSFFRKLKEQRGRKI